MIWRGKEQWGAPRGAGGGAEGAVGLGRGRGDTQSLPGPGAGAGRALFNLQVQYSLKFGILEPFWELWEGLPVKETPL